MIRKIAKNAMITVAGVAVVMALVPAIPTKADEVPAYTDTAVAGIDVAVENYVSSGAAAAAADTDAAQEAAVQVNEVAPVEEPAPAPTCQYPQFEGKCVPNVADYMNIRSEASADSEAVGKLPAGAAATVVERGEEWSKIESGSVTGYVKNELVLFGDDAGAYAESNFHKLATVTTTTLKVREEANAESTCLTMIPEGESYEVVESADGWSKLVISEDFTGYVSNEFINVEFEVGKAISKEEEEAEAARQAELARQEAAAATQAQAAPAQTAPAQTASAAQVAAASSGPVSGDRQALVDYAMQFVGCPYVYGGSSLTGGTDCSGFTMRVYEHFGYSLERCSRYQINNGTQIGIYEVQPGDLLFYNNGGSTIGHVAIYIGNGQIVHASCPRTGITVSNAYYQTPCGATRIMP